MPIPGSSLSNTTEFAWDSNNYGNLVTLSEWNFGSSLSGAADRTTSYAYLNGSSYITANILNRPSSVTVKDKNNNTVSQIVNCYDYAGGCGGSSFASATGLTNHNDTSYGTTNTVRGDLTQVKRYYSTSGYLTTSMTYDMTGNVLTSKDSNGNTTTYTYTDNFFDDNNSNPPATHSLSTHTNAYVYTITPANSSSSNVRLLLWYRAAS